MTTSEKESQISAASGDFPSWQELMESSKANMTDRLSTAESDNDRENIQREYDAALDRILNSIGNSQDKA